MFVIASKMIRAPTGETGGHVSGGGGGRLTITFCTVLKSSVTSNWCFLEVSKCQALCYMLFKSNWINNHARLMRWALFSHFTASERRLLLVTHLLKIIPPENDRAPIQPQGVLVLEFKFQPLGYTASLNHVPTLQTPKPLKRSTNKVWEHHSAPGFSSANRSSLHTLVSRHRPHSHSEQRKVSGYF